MHTKVALCYGYAELFAELCRYIFMEVSEILSSEDKQPKEVVMFFSVLHLQYRRLEATHVNSFGVFIHNINY